jgi:serine/threonine protein kinase
MKSVISKDVVICGIERETIYGTPQSFKAEGPATEEFLQEYSDDKKFNIENFYFPKLGNDYNILGQGSKSQTFLVRNNIDEKYYALKKIRKELLSPGETCSIVNGLRIYRRVCHENILQLYSFYEDSEFIYSVTEYLDNCTTLRNLVKINGGFEEKKAYKYFYQILTAVMFLQKNKLIHRGITADKILIDSKGNVKICYFNNCTDINNVNGLGIFKIDMGTTFVPSEGDCCNYSIDVWFLGMLLFELLHGELPNGKFDKVKISENVDKDCKDLLESNI